MNLLSEGFNKDHFLATADARLKLLLAAGLLIMILTHHGLLFPLTVAAAGLLLCIRLGVPLKVFVLRFSEPAFIALVLVFIKGFCTGKVDLFTISIFGLKITGYADGFTEGLIIASRIIGSVAVIAVLSFSTPFGAVLSGLSWFRVPKGLVEISMFAYRYIFMLLEEALVIYNAQKNRLGYSNLRRGLSSFGILAGSLTLKALEHSQSTALAMTQRGYDGTIPLGRHEAFKPSEVAVSALLILLMGLLWMI